MAVPRRAVKGSNTSTRKAPPGTPSARKRPSASLLARMSIPPERTRTSAGFASGVPSARSTVPVTLPKTTASTTCPLAVVIAPSRTVTGASKPFGGSTGTTPDATPRCGEPGTVTLTEKEPSRSGKRSISPFASVETTGNASSRPDSVTSVTRAPSTGVTPSFSTTRTRAPATSWRRRSAVTNSPNGSFGAAPIAWPRRRTLSSRLPTSSAKRSVSISLARVRRDAPGRARRCRRSARSRRAAPAGTRSGPARRSRPRSRAAPATAPIPRPGSRRRRSASPSAAAPPRRRRRASRRPAGTRCRAPRSWRARARCRRRRRRVRTRSSCAESRPRRRQASGRDQTAATVNGPPAASSANSKRPVTSPPGPRMSLRSSAGSSISRKNSFDGAFKPFSSIVRATKSAISGTCAAIDSRIATPSAALSIGPVSRMMRHTLRTHDHVGDHGRAVVLHHAPADRALAAEREVDVAHVAGEADLGQRHAAVVVGLADRAHRVLRGRVVAEGEEPVVVGEALGDHRAAAVLADPELHLLRARPASFRRPR